VGAVLGWVLLVSLYLWVEQGQTTKVSRGACLSEYVR